MADDLLRRPKDYFTKAEVDQLRQWMYEDINLKGHRIQNAGKSVNSGDYLTRGEFISGALVTNINANNITSGTLANARLNIVKSTWVPSQSGVALTVNSAKYWSLDVMTFFQFDVTWPVTADTTLISIAGFPFSPSVQNAGAIGFCSGGIAVNCLVNTAPRFVILKAGGVQAKNVDMSGSQLVVSGWFI